MKQTAAEKRERAETSRAALLQILKPGTRNAPGTKVYGIVRRVSSSGMSRVIDFYTFADGEPQWLSGHISNVLGLALVDDGRGLRVSGCGMDMIFHVVYSLARELWRDAEPGAGDSGYFLGYGSL